MNLFDLALRLKGFPMTEAESSIKEWQSLSNADQRKRIIENRDAIVRHHVSANPLYAKLLSEKTTEWHRVPILSKRDMQQPLEKMLSHGFGMSDVYISNTSGSSGHPFFFAKDKFCHALTWAFIMDQYRSLGIASMDWQARFYGIPLDRKGYWSEKVKDTLMHRIRFPVFDMGQRKLEEFLQKFRTTTIHYVYGYTNAILIFAEFVRNKGVVLSSVAPALKCCIVTSEVCRDEDKRLIEVAFGVPVVREYGASELDIIAIEDREGRWAINEANLYVEVLSDENEVLPLGQEGRLVITSLYNKAMPFIRYDLGDIGVLEQDDRGLVLKKLSGRVNDTILLPSGKRSPGLTFYYVSRSILESSGVLKEFIIRQTALNAFEFDIISDRPLTNVETDDIRNKMDLYLEPGLQLKINRVSHIERPASGKIKHFYSELKA